MPDTDQLFVVEPLQNSPFAAMVFALGYRRPDEWLSAVPAALRQAGITGRVVLDLLACNGNMWNRHFSAEVDPQTDRMRVQRHESETWLAEVSAGVLTQYLPLLDLSLLSDEEQLAVRKGLPLYPSSRFSSNSHSTE